MALNDVYTIIYNAEALSRAVLAAGGVDSSNALASAELYDPTTATWTATGAMATGRYFHQMVVLPDGTGQEARVLSWPHFCVLLPRCVCMFILTDVCALQSAVLVAGGLDTIGNPLASAELYDPLTRSWSTIGSMSAARYFHQMVLLANGKGGPPHDPTSSGDAKLVYCMEILTRFHVQCWQLEAMTVLALWRLLRCTNPSPAPGPLRAPWLIPALSSK